MQTKLIQYLMFKLPAPLYQKKLSLMVVHYINQDYRVNNFVYV